MSVRTIFLSFKSLEITPGTTSQCIWNKAWAAHVRAVFWEQLFKSTPILMMILWRKGLDLFYIVCETSDRDPKEDDIVTIASAACWRISDYNIEPRFQNSYFQNILQLTIIGFKKTLKHKIPIFKKRLGTYYDHPDKVLAPTIFWLTKKS